MLDDVTLNIVDGDAERTFSGPDMKSIRAISFDGRSARLTTSSADPRIVTTWVIDADQCPESAVVLDAVGRYVFTLRGTGELSPLCVFPSEDSAGVVTFGFESLSGDAVLVLPPPAPSVACPDGICRRDVNGPFYAVFENGTGKRQLDARAGTTGARCAEAYFTHFTVEGAEGGAIEGAEKALACGVTAPAATPESDPQGRAKRIGRHRHRRGYERFGGHGRHGPPGGHGHRGDRGGEGPPGGHRRRWDRGEPEPERADRGLRSRGFPAPGLILSIGVGVGLILAVIFLALRSRTSKGKAASPPPPGARAGPPLDYPAPGNPPVKRTTTVAH
jgi:hypothetical protein